MKVEAAPGFEYPHMFLVAGRVVGAAFPPVEPVGVLIVKQTIPVSGPTGAQEPVLLSDVKYPPPMDLSDPHLELELEADLVPFKPSLDLIAIRNSNLPGAFGTVRIDRGSGFEPALLLPFGWRDRRQGPRLAQAGAAAAFVPPQVADPANPPSLVERLNLPVGFRNAFFNGGHFPGLQHLAEDNVVEFHDGSVARQVEIPRGPEVTVTSGGAPISPAVSVATTADTVVYDMAGGRFLVTWRSVFPWAAHLEAATLEVH
jgi:hypothetical protein